MKQMIPRRPSTALPIVLWLLCNSATVEAEERIGVTSSERRFGFRELFNGTSFDGWEQKGNWVLTEGAMYRSRKGGDIVYRGMKIPDNFELRFEWKVSRGSNSGVYYRPGQYEYQILDNTGHSDGGNPRTSAASLYFCMAPSHDATRDIGQWNTGRIIGHGSIIQHWLNGVKVVHFDYSRAERASNVMLLKLRGAKLSDRGAYLKLQDHGDPVWFRRIRLRARDDDDELDMTPVNPAPISPDVLKSEKAKLDAILRRRNRQRD